MSRRIADWWKSLGKEVRAHPQVYFFLAIILVGGFFVRAYRLDQLLGFYFDQGRDALVIWRLLNEGKLFLIGPVTGIEGIFLGPFYYYLIAPFYLLSGGDPVGPAIFLAVLATAAVLVIYYLGYKIHSRLAGILAATIYAFSYYLVQTSRWLASPSVLLLVSALFIWCLFEIAKGRKNLWPVAAFLLGISLQLEAASAVFYLPTILLFAIWQRRKLPNVPMAFFSVAVFLATLLPQILFDLRHGGILRAAFLRFLVEEQSFVPSFWQVLRSRLIFYPSVFETNVLPGWQPFFLLILGLGLASLFVSKKLKNVGLKLLILVIAMPLFGLLFFRGNYGNVWGYYLTGVFLPFVLLYACGIAQFWRKGTQWLVLGFLVLFFLNNGTHLKNFLSAGIAGETAILFANEKQAVDWVYQDAAGSPFNVDIYVPPVVPYAYDYLFLWWGTTRYGKIPEVKEQLPLLYTLYEVDPPHPERLSAWLERQKGIGVVEKETQFGGITVQRRTRL